MRTMGSLAPLELQQIHIGVGPRGYELTKHHNANPKTYAQEYHSYQAYLSSQCPLNLWPRSSHAAFCPRPILINKQHQQQALAIHNALSIAVTHIVERWWTDKEARFPQRMPLQKEEEELLQWLETRVSCGDLDPYFRCQGSWRPDFMIEEDESNCNGAREKFRITEINARFSFNGLMHGAYGQKALENIVATTNGLSSAVQADKLYEGAFSLAKADIPLHILMEEEEGFDIHLFLEAAKRSRSATTRVVRPSDLRLIPDAQKEGGYRLCCLSDKSKDDCCLPRSAIFTTRDGETVEEIQQVGVEMRQHELHSIEPEILRQISLRCFNDMRTILLVHDKRILGIVKQELRSLVERGLIYPNQARILDEAIVDTILPGSQELKQLLQQCKLSPTLKDGYVMKPVRDGKGAGIVFGENFTPDEWISALEPLQSPELVRGTNSIVQRRVVPRLYDVVLGASGERVRYPIYGTYHSINGEFLGLGVWRSTDDPVCANTRGGSCMCSVIDSGATESHV
ncbi:hypothetical protein F5B19DRAFT_467683 [Rostrohypoxylon terebratum]|nr:hypothetical protein F5B19DRAFT_467683 [Rostrohypoxylon terebratum]